MVSEAEIIKRCREGEKHAQELLYKRYASKMLGVCIRYFRSKEEAEDALQEGFIKVFVNIEKFRGEGSLNGWIRKIMINTALNICKSELKHYFHSDINEIEEKFNFSKSHFDSYSVEDLLKLIQSLPTGYRLVFNLYEIEGYKHKEIAKMLKISVSTSKSQLLKARKLLQKKLELLNKI